MNDYERACKRVIPRESSKPLKRDAECGGASLSAPRAVAGRLCGFARFLGRMGRRFPTRACTSCPPPSSPLIANLSVCTAPTVPPRLQPTEHGASHGAAGVYGATLHGPNLFLNRYRVCRSRDPVYPNGISIFPNRMSTSPGTCSKSSFLITNRSRPRHAKG